MASLRKIVVDDHELRWRFNRHDKLVVIPAATSAPQLYVSWRFREATEPGGPGEEPHWVAPSFVANAIRFALHNGWDPAENGPPFNVRYREGEFLVEEKDDKANDEQ